jgi:hypothetical protein
MNAIAKEKQGTEYNHEHWQSEPSRETLAQRIEEGAAGLAASSKAYRKRSGERRYPAPTAGRSASSCTTWGLYPD